LSDSEQKWPEVNRRRRADARRVAFLMHINVGSDESALFSQTEKGSEPMPTDALMLSIAICIVFAVFAGVLAWLDHSTNAWRLANEAEKSSSAAPPVKKAA
jgi:hypothetical protein